MKALEKLSPEVMKFVNTFLSFDKEIDLLGHWCPFSEHLFWLRTNLPANAIRNAVILYYNKLLLYSNQGPSYPSKKTFVNIIALFVCQAPDNGASGYFYLIPELSIKPGNCHLLYWIQIPDLI